MGCIAPLVDPDSGPCYDKWGDLYPRNKQNFMGVEMDYVRLGAHGPRHTLREDHVMTCPGHHRGQGPSRGYQWATSNRDKERAYLEACYPEMDDDAGRATPDSHMDAGVPE